MILKIINILKLLGHEEFIQAQTLNELTLYTTLYSCSRGIIIMHSKRPKNQRMCLETKNLIKKNGGLIMWHATYGIFQILELKDAGVQLLLLIMDIKIWKVKTSFDLEKKKN
ncbi:hypothetical protein ACJX0J_039932 [Zea mays]